MQTHLKGFGLENFRVFKDYTWFDFAPITILTGPNSSGKSSLNKALLLMKDNFEKDNLPPYYTLTSEGFSSNEYRDLFQKGRLLTETEREFIQTFEPSSIEFNGKVHGLNEANSTKCNWSENLVMSFTIPYDIIVKRKKNSLDLYNKLTEISSTSPKLYSNRAVTEMEESEQKSKDLIDKLKENKNKFLNVLSLNEYVRVSESIRYRLSFFIKDNSAKTQVKVEIRNQNDELILKITDHEIYFDIEVFDSTIQSHEIRLRSKLSDYQKTVYSNSGITFLNWFTENGIDIDESKSLVEQIFSYLNLADEGDKIIVPTMDDILSKLDYLSTSSNESKRSYSEDNETTFINTLKFLISAKNKGFEFQNFFKDCSEAFGIDGIIGLEYDSEKGIYFPNIDGHSFTKFGYGYSQIAAMIFKIAEHGAKKYIYTSNGGYMFNGKESLMIVEEPESNLHPKYQSLLADVSIPKPQTV